MVHQGMKFMGRKDEVTLREQTVYLRKFLDFYGGLWSNDSLPLPYNGSRLQICSNV
jgi:hypothetical protein